MLIVGVPSYNGMIGKYTMLGILQASATPGTVGGWHIESGSLLTWNMNKILAQAFNQMKQGVTHLAILHTDIVVESKWADKMIGIMEDKKADIVSVVIPIKDMTGDTSTALYMGEKDGSWDIHRLTLKQCWSRGKSFTEKNLLVNTGLMMIDLRKDWITGLQFTIEDRIIQDKEGKFIARVFPEDWNFSLQAQRKGASVWATNEVKAQHYGNGMWPNWDPEIKVV